MLTKIPSSTEDSNKEMHISWAVNQQITYIFLQSLRNSGTGSWIERKKDKLQLLFCSVIWLGQTKVECDKRLLNFKELTQSRISE